MTPSPSPIQPPELDALAMSGWAFVAGLALLLLMGAGVITAIIYASKLPGVSMLTTTLAVLAVVLVGAYAVFGEARSDLIPLASAVIGALAAKLTDGWEEARHAEDIRTLKGGGFRDTP